jgi:hypothetical protein
VTAPRLTPPGRWRCPCCSQQVTTLVATIGPPRCTRHTGPPVTLEPIPEPEPEPAVGAGDG